mgnify:CR=1 FL=1
MQLEIITPDKKVFEGECTSVSVPGADGHFQMLNNHAPIISTLGNGLVKVKSGNKEQLFNIKGGVVEMLNNKLIVLAEKVEETA